jgi:hypothetical protein
MTATAAAAILLVAAVLLVGRRAALAAAQRPRPRLRRPAARRYDAAYERSLRRPGRW